MPVPLLIPSLIGGIIETAVDEAQNAPPEPAPAIAAGVARILPANAEIGDMSPPQAGSVEIGGQTFRLSPAVLIRNEMNMLVMPAAITQPVTVRYLTDLTGAVWRIWILTPAELAAAR